MIDIKMDKPGITKEFRKTFPISHDIAAFYHSILVLVSFGFIISSCKIVVNYSMSYNIVELWWKHYPLSDYQLVHDETNDIN